MKLSKKTGMLFIGIIIVTIVLYVVSSQIMVNYLYEGEKTRITGISTGCIGRLEGKINKIAGEAYKYKIMLTASNSLKNQYGIQALEELKIIEQFEKDEYQYNIILDSDLKVKYSIKEDAQTVPTDSELESYILKNIALKKPITGIVTTSRGTYIISTVSLTQNLNAEYTENQYFIGVSRIGEDFIQAIEGEGKRSVEIIRSLDPQFRGEVVAINEKKQLLLEYGEGKIDAYYLIPQIEGITPLYLKITEPLVVQMSTKENIKHFTAILIVLCSIIYSVLWLLINRMIVKPIHRLNEGINAINNSRDIQKRLDEVVSQDEIGVLTKDINRMFDSLEQVQLEKEVKEKKYQTLVKTMMNAYATCKVIYDEERNIKQITCIECNDAMMKMFSEPIKAHYNNSLGMFKNNSFQVEELKHILLEIEKTGVPYYSEETQLTKELWGQVTIFSLEQDQFTIIINDITKIKQYVNEMQHMANYDGLTGIKNRYSLYEHLSVLVKEQKEFYIYFMDLDNFKKLNDTIGHTEGDKVLCTVADRLKELSDANTFVSRVGGDEFVIIRRNEGKEGEITAFGERIIRVLNTQFNYHKYNFDLRVSIGVSIYPFNGQDIETLLKYADIAMYYSKSKGGNRLEIFSDRMLEQIEIEAKLGQAVEKKEFVAYYQPVYNLEKEQIVGAEALVRWVQEGEIISPVKFIDIAKQTGDIVGIDYFVLKEACAFCKEWRMKGYDSFNVSVNMSFRTLSQPRCLETIQEYLSHYDLTADAIKIEITEDEVIDRPKQMIAILNSLRELGIRISLDDFGIGYSSFNHIKMLPIDTLKIDRSLVIKIERDEKTLAIIGALIELAHQLGLDVICEGIELEEQIQKLVEVGCDTIQGYYISQPVEPKLFEQYMLYYESRRNAKKEQ